VDTDLATAGTGLIHTVDQAVVVEEEASVDQAVVVEEASVVQAVVVEEASVVQAVVVEEASVVQADHTEASRLVPVSSSWAVAVRTVVAEASTAGS